jgi:ribonuclease H / adenosylcobalamin/alpha-ribazole phosphatase
VSKLSGLPGAIVKLVIQADGGSRGNPGLSGAGAVVLDAESGKVLKEISEPLGIATNNYAEYSAVIFALEAALEIDPDAEILVQLDSKLVVEQMSGRWKIKHPDMLVLGAKVQKIISGKDVEFAWIPREQNGRADALANLAMDGAPLNPSSVEYNHTEPSSIRAPRPKDSAATTLILIRHGRTELTESRRISGGDGENPRLSDLGRKDAALLANELAKIGSTGSFSYLAAPEVVIHSPVLRAKETAEVVAKKLGLPLQEMNELAEISFGDWDGLTNEEVFAGFEQQYTAWRGSYDVAPPNGESLASFEERISVAFEKILTEHRGKTAIVISHVMPVRGFLKIANDASIAGFWRPSIAPASISIARYWGSEAAEVLCVNSTSHLSS